MPRNQKSNSNTSDQLSVRCDGDLKQQYKAALDDQGKSMSEDLREHMQKVVERHGGQTDDLLPQQPKARKGLKAIVDHAYRWRDGWIVEVDEVRSAIKDEANTSDGSLYRQVFKPLEENDYLRPASWGKFEVRPETVRRLREDVTGPSPSVGETAEDECAICGEDADAEDLSITDEGHPQGPNLVACPNCADSNEVTAHGD